MEKYYREEKQIERESEYGDYVPKWAKILVDLYTSFLKYEASREMGYNVKSR